MLASNPVPALPLASFVALGLVPNPSKPWFPHLEHEDNGRTGLRVLVRINAPAYTEGLEQCLKY